MKLVTAIIKPDKVEALRKALNSIEIQGLTVVEAKGYGRQKGHTEMYRGAEYEVHFLPKSRAEILINDKDLDKVIHDWKEDGIRVEKARWGRHHIIQGKKKVEIGKEVDALTLTLEQAKNYLGTTTQNKKKKG